ncbi:NAD(P)-dependent oxidoreductase [Streptomyces umbrinus]|uniref:NAD(P)-dependent oxidoreductase n=1 Tax=Streptomyces umbrinus TaxID=67370 RepID=UPI003443CE0A
MTQNRDADRMPVTVIGLGLMGQALAGALLRAGHPTTVWNRSAAKAEPLVAQGATLADSIADAVAAAPLVVVCLSDYDTAHKLLDPVGELLDGRTLVNLTSGTSAQARETAEWAARHGVAYLDGVILAVPDGIGTADAIILCSGPRAAFDLHEPALRSLAEATTYLGGDHTLSALHDMAVLGLMWGVLNGFLQGAALLGAAGVDPAAFVPLVRQGIGIVTDWLPGYAQQINEGTYPAFDATLDTHRAAMEHLAHESESRGVNADLPRFIQALADRALADGRGGDGYAAMIEQFRKSSEARS